MQIKKRRNKETHQQNANWLYTKDNGQSTFVVHILNMTHIHLKEI